MIKELFAVVIKFKGCIIKWKWTNWSNSASKVLQLMRKGEVMQIVAMTSTWLPKQWRSPRLKRQSCLWWTWKYRTFSRCHLPVAPTNYHKIAINILPSSRHINDARLFVASNRLELIDNSSAFSLDRSETTYSKHRTQKATRLPNTDSIKHSEAPISPTTKHILLFHNSKEHYTGNVVI